MLWSDKGSISMYRIDQQDSRSCTTQQCQTGRHHAVGVKIISHLYLEAVSAFKKWKQKSVKERTP